MRLRGAVHARTILMVTESAFYPPYRGDSRRLFGLIGGLRQQGWRVSVVNLHDRAQPDLDYKAMAGYCDGLSIYYPTDDDLRHRDWNEMDTYCPLGLVRLVGETARRIDPQVIWTQFVFLSRCLTVGTASHRHLKVIDADNKFAGRSFMYHQEGINYDWFSTDEAQERRGLLRADLILAIQEQEADYFSRLVPERPVILVPHLEPVAPLPPSDGELLFFVGAANCENALGITRFLNEAFPRIRQRRPKVHMRIAGRVCELLRGTWERVELLGLVDNLHEHYAEAAIVLNPTPVGSGTKIKTVEALCHGRCLVTTRHGAQGLENYSDSYCLADTPDEFAAMIISLLDQPQRRAEIGRRARDFAATYFDPTAITRRLETAILSRVGHPIAETFDSLSTVRSVAAPNLFKRGMTEEMVSDGP